MSLSNCAFAGDATAWLLKRQAFFSLILTILAQQGNCSSWTQSLNVSWHVKMKFGCMNFLFTLVLVQNNKIKQNTTCIIINNYVERKVGHIVTCAPVWMMGLRNTRHEEQWTCCVGEHNHWDYHCWLAINWNPSYSSVTQQHWGSRNPLAGCFLWTRCSPRCSAQ